MLSPEVFSDLSASSQGFVSLFKQVDGRSAENLSLLPQYRGNVLNPRPECRCSVNILSPPTCGQCLGLSILFSNLQGGRVI